MLTGKNSTGRKAVGGVRTPKVSLSLAAKSAELKRQRPAAREPRTKAKPRRQAANQTSDADGGLAEENSHTPSPYHLVSIGIDELHPSPYQRRKRGLDDASLAELAASIRQLGVLQEPIARIVRNGSGDLKHYELVCGERRWRAARLAGRKDLVVRVVHADDQQAAEIVAVENLQREQMAPLEEAEQIAVLRSTGRSAEAIADRIGRSPRFVAERLLLAANLAGVWKAAYDDPDSPIAGWPVGNLLLLALLSRETQQELFDGELHFYTNTVHHAPSQSQLTHVIDQKLLRLKAAPFSVIAHKLLPDVGSCNDCPKRSSQHDLLFVIEGVDDDRCLDGKCWNRKADRWVDIKTRELAHQHGGDAAKVPKITTDFGDKYEDVPEVLHEWDVCKAEPGTPGAVEAVIIDGPEAGKTQWIIAPDYEPPADLEQPAKRAAKQPPPASGYAGRIRRFFEQIEAATPPRPSVVLALNLMFSNLPHFADGKAAQKAWEELSNNSAETTRAVWKQLCDDIDLSVSSTETEAGRWDVCLWLADFVDLNVKPIETMFPVEEAKNAKGRKTLPASAVDGKSQAAGERS